MHQNYFWTVWFKAPPYRSLTPTAAGKLGVFPGAPTRARAGQPDQKTQKVYGTQIFVTDLPWRKRRDTDSIEDAARCEHVAQSLGKRTFMVPSRGKQMQQLLWKGWYTDPPKNARLFPWYRSYSWWFRNPVNSPLEVGSLSHNLQVFLLHPRWVPRFFFHQQYHQQVFQCVNGHQFQSYPDLSPTKIP